MIATLVLALTFAWPEPTVAMKPWVYNWWMGSAVDEQGLEFQSRELAEKGFGGFHVIPTYGAKGWESKYRPLLSPDWIAAWNGAADAARRHGLGIDLTMGAGWCFGGPWVKPEESASSGMRVKRAGPGGEGPMIDPFSATAMSNHVAQFAAAFGKGGAARRPRAFYHDSYEYFDAQPRRPGDFEELQVACFRVWTDWCRANGYLSRNEGHGAPANWLDLYALADIPETEMFGANDRDILISKFASSAAHVKGTTLVSAEACTWIGEHFRERPEEIKRFLDRLFLAGANHVFYHGCCYSPVGEAWPGWCFYASLEMNPRNPIWREMGALNAYVTRCQSMFQTWTPDNDLAVVFTPHAGGRQMTVHDRDWFYGNKIGPLARELFAAGYCFDYVSPRQLKTCDLSRYAEVIDPDRDERPAKARREPIGSREDGLAFARFRKDGHAMLFLVNQSRGETVRFAASRPFTAMDPLDGSVREVSSADLLPGHSLFVIDAKDYCATALQPTRPAAEPAVELRGTWNVRPVCGGPALPAATNLTRLASWTSWDEAFSGTMRYACRFDVGTACPEAIDLGEVHEIARVRLNGTDLGVRFMPPYAFRLPKGVCRANGNELEVEVTGLGSNRLRWNDRSGIPWKKFNDINMVDSQYRPLDAAKYPLVPNGLLGPVRLRACSNGY